LRASPTRLPPRARFSTFNEAFKMTNNKVLEQRLAASEQEATEKDKMLGTLMTYLNLQREAMKTFVKGADEATCRKITELGLMPPETDDLERSLGRFRTQLEDDSRPIKTFNPKNGIRLSLQERIVPPYTMKMRFRNLRQSSDLYNYSDQFPPMPLVFGPFAIYLTDPETVRIFIEGGGEGASVDLWDDGGWHDLCVEASTTGYTITVDGSRIIQSESLKPLLVNKVMLGCGHKNRGWNGQIASFAAVAAPWDSSDTVLPDDNVVLHYDGEKFVDL
jgi:hypothetical protein